MLENIFCKYRHFTPLFYFPATKNSYNISGFKLFYHKRDFGVDGTETGKPLRPRHFSEHSHPENHFIIKDNLIEERTSYD